MSAGSSWASVANIIIFPRLPERAWQIVPIDADQWRGELVERGRLIRRTEDGTHSLVWGAVQQHRQGLPIVDASAQPSGRAA